MDQRERADDPLATLKAAMDGHQATVWTALPARVQAWDAAKRRADVQPTVQGQVRDKAGKVSSVNLPLIPSCPVMMHSGGGFEVTTPLAEGDEGLVIFACRNTDAWLQQGGVQRPADPRMHDLSDAFFVPGLYSDPRVPDAAAAAGAAQLRTRDGKTFVAVTQAGEVDLSANQGAAVVSVKGTGEVDISNAIGTVTLKADGEIDIVGPAGTSVTIKGGEVDVATGGGAALSLKSSGELHITSTGGTVIDGPLLVNGPISMGAGAGHTMTLNGDIIQQTGSISQLAGGLTSTANITTTGGALVAAADVIAQSISLVNHHHTAPAGGGATSPSQP